MGISKPIRAISKCTRKSYFNRFDHIPKELVSEIISRVASSSFADLYNAKLSCKDFLKASAEDSVFESVSIDGFPVISWKNNNNYASKFLDKCRRTGNLEAMFRQGMIDYFSNLKYDSGIGFLKKAAYKNHMEATYVYGIILVCHGRGMQKQGLNLLSNKFGRKNLSVLITECRKKVKEIVGFMWVNNYLVGFGPEEQGRIKIKSFDCNCNRMALCSSTEFKKSGWKTDIDFEDDDYLCDSCLWCLEATKFCNMLRIGRFEI